jgi:hypothetical protein
VSTPNPKFENKYNAEMDIFEIKSNVNIKSLDILILNINKKIPK